MTLLLAGRGSKFSVSIDGGVNWTRIGQLRKFPFSGKKTVLLDTSNIRSGNFKQNLAVQVDCGEVALDGVLNPWDSGYGLLNSLQDGLSEALWKIELPVAQSSDAPTTYTFAGCVSELVPADISYNKLIAFTAKINISGGITIALGTSPGATEDEDMGMTWATMTSSGTAPNLTSVMGVKAAAGGDITIALTPAAKQTYSIVQKGSGIVTITSGGSTIYQLVNTDQCVVLAWDGAEWLVIGGTQ